MRSMSGLGLTLATVVGLSTLGAQAPSPAVTLQNGQVYFDHPPTLDDATTTERRVTASTATYYFTLSLPNDAGEPLQRVVIQQKDGSTHLRQVAFVPDQSRAFVGTERDRQDTIPLGTTEFDPDTQTVRVTFDPPIQPGTTVTIGLHPERNPRQDGIYLFGVTAFPPGEAAHGQFLGYGRLDFTGSDHPLFLNQR